MGTSFAIDFLESYSEDSLIAEIQRVAALLPKNGHFTAAIYEAASPKVSVSTLRRRFGGWRQALERAGLAARYSGTPVSEKMRIQPAKRLSNGDLIAELQRVHKLSGTEWLTSDDFNARSVSSEEAVRRRFGSFRKGLELAGIPSHPSSNRQISEVDCFENLAMVWTTYGRTPTYREMNHSPSMIKGRGYDIRWGTWRGALIAFVNWANEDKLLQVETPHEPETNEPIPDFDLKNKSWRPRSSEEDRREVRPALRFRVFRRDSFRCVACGRSPATHLGVELHADHILAVVHGGKTTLENLQTLCVDCNLGKGKS